MGNPVLPQTDLSRFDNRWFDEGAPRWKWMLWFLASGIIMLNPLNPFNFLRVGVLRLFGAKIGKGVIVKHRVVVKFPWNLEIGDHTWIGEATWIENQGKVKIGRNCCLSQGVVLMTGNHDYKSPTFDLMVKPIELEDGVWIGSHSVVTQGVTCRSHAVLSVLSAATKDLEPYTIYAGNPCQAIRGREMKPA